MLELFNQNSNTNNGLDEEENEELDEDLKRKKSPGVIDDLKSNIHDESQLEESKKLEGIKLNKNAKTLVPGVLGRRLKIFSSSHNFNFINYN